MTPRICLFFLALYFATNLAGQTRSLTGKIIDIEFNTLYQVSIFNADKVLLAKTDTNGNFNIHIPADTKTLMIATVGMEWKNIELVTDCNNLEVILQPDWTYDFKGPAKVDRLRKKEFNKLPGLHISAFKKGIFISDKPCYIDKFISYKKEMIERYKARTQMSGN